ncbi:hypothetical protein [Hoeflea prorocentri]|uniref:Uncharacterized protein n=1 Tax=Hoeflea prorocentri TaxID=1922333 RepID=A0A9X3ZG53_9HYPH|nr:hypothetical protein [Hoeflea prorocentri]MCY6379394.1 hypothetical protein [Hoeflea prorocentri]MDA5397195.1 hypothetical protein [Hoeflea prorocentri]
MGSVMLGSITDLTSKSFDQIVLAGSHCGLATGQFALSCNVRALVCSDAGIGLDQAGISGLQLLNGHKIPAVSVSHMSARIGDPHDMLRRGRISHVNGAAAELGIKPGHAVSTTVRTLTDTAPRRKEGQLKNHHGKDFTRRLLTDPNGGIDVVIMDSASLIGSSDDGCIVVTGSHGSLPDNNKERALKARPILAVFNDAGVGIDKAGISRIRALNAIGVAAVCVDADSARIGDGSSTYETGVISHLNEEAKALFLEVGMSVRTAIELIQKGSSAGEVHSPHGA